MVNIGVKNVKKIKNKKSNLNNKKEREKHEYINGTCKNTSRNR